MSFTVSTKIIYALLIVLSTIFSLCHSMTILSYTLKGKEKFCLHEYFSDKTLITFIVTVEKQNSVNVIIRDHENKKLIEKKEVDHFKDSFTTYGGGNYEICVINVLTFDNKVDFDFRSGVAAKDFSQVPKLKDLEPIEQELQILEDATKELYHLIMYADSHEKTYESLQDGLLVGLSWVSIIVIIIMLLVGGAEAFIGRKIVMSRKLK